MTSKIRIRMGQIEVEYEGDEQFLKDELPDLLGVVSKLCKETGATIPVASTTGAGDPAPRPATSPVGTTSNIAAKLSCSSGPDLILAAAARLTIGGVRPLPLGKRFTTR